jgi:hypothetical protein
MSGSISYGIPVDEHCAALERSGVAVMRGADGVFWLPSERICLERHPIFRIDAPPAAEIRQIFWKKWAAVATFILLPDAEHPANAWLYVCEDKSYSLEKLGAQARRNIRRAMRRFRFEPIDHRLLREKGERIYCETRARVGLSDGTAQAFRGLCDSLGSNPANRIIGAWAGDELAAFLVAVTVEDWIAFSVYGANDHLNSCPGEGLIYHLLEQFLAQGNGRVVSYGLSSIQDADNTLTLDYFKKKVGFDARPVHRAFVFHPLLRPLLNSCTYWLLRCLVRLRPRNRILRKALGMVAFQIGRRSPLRMPESESETASSGEELPADSPTK